MEKRYNEADEQIELLLENADSAFDAGSFELAIMGYSEVLAIDPRHVGALMNRGAAYHSLGLFEKALEDDLAALEYDSEDEKLYFNTGLVLNAMERNREALDYYRKALRLSGGYGLAHYAMANTLSFLDRHEEALEYYRLADQHGVDYEDLYRFWALSLERCGEYAEAIEVYHRALRQAGDDTVLPRLAYCYRMVGEDCDAEMVLLQALKQEPVDCEAFISLAVLYHEQDRKAEHDAVMKRLFERKLELY